MHLCATIATIAIARSRLYSLTINAAQINLFID